MADHTFWPIKVYNIMAPKFNLNKQKCLYNYLFIKFKFKFKFQVD